MRQPADDPLPPPGTPPAAATLTALRTIHSPAGAHPAVILAGQVGPGFLPAPPLPGPAVPFAVVCLVDDLPWPWGAGPRPHARQASPRRRGVADWPATQGEKPR